MIDRLIFLEEIGKAFVLKRFRPTIRAHFLKANIEEVPYKLFGALFYLTQAITAFFYFYQLFPHFQAASGIKVFLFAFTYWTAASLALAVLFVAALYFYLDIIIFNRTKQMEEVLQDFLRLVSENLKGGMAFERALWSSIKPEFSVLASEVRLAAKRVMTGEDVESALREFTNKYDSAMLTRSFELIVEGMKGGGRIVEIIDRVIETIEETKELKEEMRATNLTYVIFVTVVVVIVAPALFTLSYQFLIVLQNFSSRIGTTTVQSAVELPISLGKITVDTSTFRNFSLAALAAVSFFASLIVSIIQKGDIKAGVKYVPLFMAGSLVTYYILMQLATAVFSNLFTL